MQRRVWESIAQSWNRRRQEPWKEVADFSKNKKHFLDLGCGSGRNFLQGKNYVSIDFSKEMLLLAKQNAKKKKAKAHLIRADLSELPLKSNIFENVLLVAALHVLVGDKKRRCLEEARRVMKKGCHALVTVWNKNQPRFAKSRKVVFVPWNVDDKKYMRYYYLFEKDDLKSLLSKYFEIEYIESERKLGFGENIVAVVKKL